MTRTKLRSRLVAKERERCASLCDAEAATWRKAAAKWRAMSGGEEIAGRADILAHNCETLARQIREGVEP